MDACKSVGAMATSCTCMVWVATLCGVWYSDSVLVSLLMILQYCTFSFVFFGTIVLKRSNNSAATTTVGSPLEMFGTLQYAGYSIFASDEASSGRFVPTTEQSVMIWGKSQRERVDGVWCQCEVFCWV